MEIYNLLFHQSIPKKILMDKAFRFCLKWWLSNNWVESWRVGRGTNAEHQKYTEDSTVKIEGKNNIWRSDVEITNSRTKRATIRWIITVGIPSLANVIWNIILKERNRSLCFLAPFSFLFLILTYISSSFLLSYDELIHDTDLKVV